jgi:hypothetical protein
MKERLRKFLYEAKTFKDMSKGHQTVFIEEAQALTEDMMAPNVLPDDILEAFDDAELRRSAALGIVGIALITLSSVAK